MCQLRETREKKTLAISNQIECCNAVKICWNIERKSWKENTWKHTHPSYYWTVHYNLVESFFSCASTDERTLVCVSLMGERDVCVQCRYFMFYCGLNIRIIPMHITQKICHSVRWVSIWPYSLDWTREIGRCNVRCIFCFISFCCYYIFFLFDICPESHLWFLLIAFSAQFKHMISIFLYFILISFLNLNVTWKFRCPFVRKHILPFQMTFSYRIAIVSGKQLLMFFVIWYSWTDQRRQFHLRWLHTSLLPLVKWILLQEQM